MRRTETTRNDASEGRQSETRRRESASGSGDRTAPEEPLAALHRAGGNQAVQSLAGRERVDRAASGGSAGGTGQVPEGADPLPGGPTADLCPRCIRRYRAGKPLECEECESALNAGASGRAVEASTDGPAVQPKLEVSDPDDRYEREAERVAEAVMRDDAGASPGVEREGSPEAVQRMCSACRERFRRGEPLNCEECEAELQRAPDSSGGAVDGDAAEQVRAARTGGRPLPERTRSYFESRMGRDFGDVRVHTGTQADEAARSLNARAFTLGSDVVFRAGEYRPHTRSGKRLLAHELTHVVQQGGGRGAARSTVSEGESRDATREPTPDVDVSRRDADGIQRWHFGTEGMLIQDPVSDEYFEAPEEDRGRVQAAMDIVGRIVNNPDRYPRCHEAFGGELRPIYEDARVWKEPPGEGEEGKLLGSHTSYDIEMFGLKDVAYTDYAHRLGKWTIAATLVHEMAHIADIEHDDTPSNEQVVGMCGLPTLDDITKGRATEQAKSEVGGATEAANDAASEAAENAPNVETVGETEIITF